MKALIIDKFQEESLGEIRGLGLEVIYEPGCSGEDLLRKVKDVHFLIVRSSEVRKPVIDAARQLAMIIRAGAGTNTIDVKDASARGIYVANCPGKNSVAVAELAMGLILAIDRRIPDNVAELRRGKWNKKEFSKADGLMGKTLGIVGLGQIGRELAARAAAFGMNVVAWSRSLTPEMAEELGIGRCDSVEALAAAADVVSVHLALAPETKGLIGKKVFDAMKKGAIFINTARGEVVDEKALREAIERKGIRAGLDVYRSEPAAATAEFGDDIAQIVYGTHHIGASTEQAQTAIARETVRILRDFLASGVVHNCVNLCRKSPASCQLLVRHYDRVGVLAGVFDILKENSINIQEVENTIFDGAVAACCKMRLDSAPAPGVLARIGENKDIINVDLLEVS